MGLEIGWSIKMKCGQRAKIINIVNENDIDVEFEDGGIVYHTTYHKLLMRGFKSPEELKRNPKKITYEKVLAEFELKDYILLSKEYVDAFYPLEYVCKKHPDKIQTTTWNKIQQGSGCRECGYEIVSNKLRLAKKTPYQEVKEKFSQNNLLLLTTEEEYLTDSNPIMKFVCPCTPDKIQSKTWSAFLQAPHCSLCYKKDIREKHREKSFEEFLDICSSRGYTPLSTLEDYTNCFSKLRYICPNHGEKQTTLSHLREGKGCKECGYAKVGEKGRLSEEEVRKRIDDKELVLISSYQSIHDIGEFMCKRHPSTVFKARISDVIYSDVKCPACHESKGEKKIRLWLEKQNIKYEPQKRFDNLYRFDKAHKLSYDFYLPFYNLLIEYQGEFHDGTAWQQSKEQYNQQIEKDRMKKEYALNNQYNFLEIWYWDYKNIETILERELIKIGE